ARASADGAVARARDGPHRTRGSGGSWRWTATGRRQVRTSSRRKTQDRNGFDEVQRFELAVSQARHLRMTLGITNVPTDEENTGRAAYVIEHGQREERVFAW